MSKKGDRLRDRAEELRANADNIRVEECHRISLELAELAEEPPRVVSDNCFAFMLLPGPYPALPCQL
jgi:hypothetical protein